MTWTRACFTDAQVAAGDCYRLHRRFGQVYAGASHAAGMAMFSTAFLPGQPCVIYFSPAVLAEAPTFSADVEAQPCGKPESSVSLWIGAIDARDMLGG